MGAVTNAPTAIDVLLESFGRIPDLLHDVVEDLDADTLIRQPVVDGHPNNSIGWIVWHIGRMADAQIADITDSPEVHADGWAERLGVPLVRAFEGVPGTPFQALPVLDNRFWREVALWEPESRTLLCADVLGTLEFFRAGDERIGMHPFLRLAPPRSLLSVAPERVLVGHGGGLDQDAAEAVHDTVRNARRRIPAALASAARAVRNSRRSRN